MSEAPAVVVLAGPNGAGKTTAAPFLLRDHLQVPEFVNADDIARGLSGFAPEHAAMAAGRILLRRVKDLAEERNTFAFETTLATRSYAPWLQRLKASGYRVALLFLALPDADTAVDRVRRRVSEGGHDVPENTVRRRYSRGLVNFFTLYSPLASEWTMYDNSGRRPETIAEGILGDTERVAQPSAWNGLKRECRIA